MHFQALTLTQLGAGSLHTHTSAEVAQSIRELLQTKLSKNHPRFSLPPHWEVQWDDDGDGMAVATYYWRGVDISFSVMAYSTWLDFLDDPGLIEKFEHFVQLRRLSLPAMANFLATTEKIAQRLKPSDLLKAFEMLGDLDRCIACVYFEQMEAAKVKIQ